MPSTLPSGIPIPEVPVSFVPAKAGEVLALGLITCRIMEDGSNTDNRLGVAELILPPKTPGIRLGSPFPSSKLTVNLCPPPHWHQMHDESFFVTKGALRFHIPDLENPGQDKKQVEAKAGDYMVVPINSPHTFSNPHDEEARCVFTSTPAFYINYFKLLSVMGEEGKPMPAEVNMTAMAMFATTLVDKQPRKPQ